MPKKATAPLLELGAIILTVINMGQDALLFPLTSEKDIRRLWKRFLEKAVTDELPENSMDEERAYWERQLQNKDWYSIATVKEYAAWLVESEAPKTSRSSNGVSR